jgi:nitroreductase
VAFSGIYKVTRFAARAPVLILILARRGNVADAVGNVLQATDFHLLDIGIAGEHLALAATERGLGTCWIGWFNKKRVRKLLCIPRRFDLVAMMALGYPDPTELAPKRKKKLSDIVRYNRFDWDS